MRKLLVRVRDNWFYIIAIILPWLIAVVHSAYANTWITGNGGFAIGDFQAIIVPAGYELWDKVHSGDVLSFTWHVADGADFNSVVSYLFSPFTIIMLILPRTMIADYLQLLMIAKWSLLSFFMVYFFYHTSFNTMKCNKKLTSLFLGLSYVLSNGILSYILYINMVEVMLCFPFLLLLVERMVKEKKWRLYYILLTYTIMCNSYIAFMICIFLAFWFVLNISFDKKEIIKKFLIFSGSSILAALTDTWSLITGLNLSKGRISAKDYSEIHEYIKGILVPIHTFIEQLFLLKPVSQSYSPNIYFSVTAVCLILFFVAVRIDWKQKFLILSFACVLVLSYFAGWLNLAWHMFSIPNGFMHRFTFIFIFFMLFMLLMVLVHLNDIQYIHLAIVSIFSLSMTAYSFFNIEEYDSMLIYFLTFMIIVFLILMLTFYLRKSIDYKNIIILIAVCGISELTINCFNSFSYYDGVRVFGKDGYMTKAADLLDGADIDKGERICATAIFANLGLISGHNSDSGFVSMINTNNRTLHERLGLEKSGDVEFASLGASPLVNLIFNIRYGIGESELLYSDADLEKKTDLVNLYRIDRLAGLGYMVDDLIADWTYDGENCFEYQNKFVNKAVGGEDIFSIPDGEAVLTDFIGVPCEHEAIEAENGVYSYHIDKPVGGEFDARVFRYVPNEDMDLYLFFKSKDILNVIVFIDGECVHEDLEPFDQSTYHIGNVKKGQEIKVFTVPRFASIDDNNSRTFIVAKFNNDVYDNIYNMLSNNVLDVEVERSDYIKGSIVVDREGIMMTSVPDIEGFKVYVDDEQVEKCVIGDALIGVPLDKGKHVIEFRYHAPIDSKGIIISVMALVVFVIICFVTGNNSLIYEKRINKENGSIF